MFPNFLPGFYYQSESELGVENTVLSIVVTGLGLQVHGGVLNQYTWGGSDPQHLKPQENKHDDGFGACFPATYSFMKEQALNR